MRVLFLHEVNYALKPIFEMHEFPELLSLNGHDVAFLDYQENGSGNKSNEWGQYLAGRYRSESRIRFFSQPEPFRGILGRLVAVMRFPSFFQKVLEEFDPEIVVSFSVPTSGWQALAMCRKRGIPYLHRALDVSHRIRRTMYSVPIKMAETFIYRNASWISCNNPAMREYCLSHGAKEAMISVDLPPLELTHFLRRSRERDSVRGSLGISEDAVVILYMGSFFYFSGLDQVMRDLARHKHGPILVLIGGGEQELELKDLAHTLKIEDQVRFTGYVEFGDLPSYLQIADIAINPMIPELVSNTALPNKVLQYMASRLPVVSTRLKGLSSLLGDVAGLKLVDSPSEVLGVAISLANQSDLEQLGGQNQKTVAELFSTETSLAAFEQLLERVRNSF